MGGGNEIVDAGLGDEEDEFRFGGGVRREVREEVCAGGPVGTTKGQSCLELKSEVEKNSYRRMACLSLMSAMHR